MASHVAGTVIGGALRLDERIELPDETRVKITVEPVEETPSPIEAWEELKASLRERPIHAQGLHFTRDELHERR